MPLLIPFTFIIGDLTTVVGAPPQAQQAPPNLNELVTTYSHSIADRYGFESATIGYTGDRAMALNALNLLGRSLTIGGMRGAVCWDGLVWSVDVSAAGVSHSVSLENVANRIKVRFTAPFGTSAVSSTYSDSTSQALYGIKDMVVTGGAKTLIAANALAQRVLFERKTPSPEVGIGLQTGEVDSAGWTITLNCVGLYETLGYCVTSSTSTTSTVTTTQVASLLAGDPNAWVLAGDIVASGISDVETIDEDTPRRAKIEALLNQGNSSNQPLSWGVYEDRKFTVTTWAGSGVTPAASEPTRLYTTNQQEMTIRNAEGSIVDWWHVRPNYRYAIDLLDSATLTSVGNSATTGVIGRVSFSCDEQSMSLNLEGVYRSSADAIIARVR
jgi:hypothetical protein